MSLWKTMVAGLMLGGSARAQDSSVDIELFRPYPDAYGYFSVPSASTLGHLQLGGSIWGSYENDSLILINEDLRVAPNAADVNGDDGDGVLDDRVLSNIQVGLGLSRYFSFSIDAPLVLWQDGYQVDKINNPTTTPSPLISAGIGDIRVQPKLVALDTDRSPVGLAVQVPVGIPTGNGGSFLGEESFSVTPMLVTEFADGSVRARKYSFRTALTAGYRVRETGRVRDVSIGNELVYGLGMGVHPAEAIEIVGEFHGTISGPQPAQQPAEILGGFKFLIGRLVVINVGGGAGILPGIGAPDYRVLTGLTVAPSFDPNARDVDKDGIMDGADQCRTDPEDPDGYQDEDGCPELDNDVDNIPDNLDQCPNDPEDDDGYMDNDGCPDADNDKDSILDVADRCPDEAETNNGYMDEDGCPDEKPVEDTDGDGYKNDVDHCPYDAEDFDSFQDEDGCPETDNDNDGVVDHMDQCPLDREVYNGIEDEDGCPDEGRVVVEKDFIKIRDRIYFEFAKARIQERSQSLLDEIAATIAAHPEILVIRIEGHTDDVGADVTNLKLSQSRADAVMKALVFRGIAENRLDAVGFGEMRPISSNANDDGRAENRRVEFIIVDRE